MCTMHKSRFKEHRLKSQHVCESPAQKEWTGGSERFAKGKLCLILF